MDFNRKRQDTNEDIRVYTLWMECLWPFHFEEICTSLISQWIKQQMSEKNLYTHTYIYTYICIYILHQPFVSVAWVFWLLSYHTWSFIIQYVHRRSFPRVLFICFHCSSSICRELIHFECAKILNNTVIRKGRWLTAQVQTSFQSQLHSLGKSLHHFESYFLKKCTVYFLPYWFYGVILTGKWESLKETHMPLQI